MADFPRGRGPRNAKLMFLGEAYGKDEKAQGKPFVGPAGRVLDELCLQAGVKPSECYYTNIVNQQPPANDLSTWIPHGVPGEIAQEGISALNAEIEDINPNIIVPLGNWPLWATYGLKINKEGFPTGILDYRGYVLEARRIGRGRKIMPTVHPSYILQGGYPDTPLAIMDLQRAKRESAFPEIRRRPRQKFIDPQGDEREAIRHRLMSEGKWIAFDIEYIGTRLLCIGFCVSADWSVTIRIRSPADVAWCRSIIESGRPLCAQNAMYDCGILEWYYKIDAFKNLRFDTMVAAYNLNIEFRKDLGFLGSMYTDLPAWWDVINWDKIKNGQQSIDTVWDYNCDDCLVTYEAAETQDVELDSDPKMREAFEFDMRKLYPLWKMSRRGVKIDTKKLGELKARAVKDADENQRQLNEIAEAVGMSLGKMDVNVKSGPQMVELLFGHMEIPVGGRTPPSTRFPKGQLKTDNITLMECHRKADTKLKRKAIELVVRTREARDLDSKFAEVEWDADGRARCTYDSTKTVTRRLSSKKFFPTGKGSNLQNIPAPGSNRYGEMAREVFVPDIDREFGYADLKGAEFLIVAELTQDPLMLKYAQMTIDGTGDVHRETAGFLFKIQDVASIGKESPQRYLGKKTRHSGNYMIGWKKFMGNINAEALETGVYISAAESKSLLGRYVELHPGLPRWWGNTDVQLRKGRMLRNLFGFPRRFNDRLGAILPEAVAFVPQSTVGDCLNYGLIACDADEELIDYGFELLLNVHDAIGYQYFPKFRLETTKRVRELMSIPILFPETQRTLRIPVEIAVGASWGKLEIVK